MIVTPIVERLIENEKKKRLTILFPCVAEEEKEEKKPDSKFNKLTLEQVLIFKYAEKNKYCSVGTSVLEKHYQDDDVVDISSLHEKKLIRTKSEHLGIISAGRVSKRLTVYAHSCTSKAHKKIVEAGGTVTLLQDQAQDLEEGEND
jgi:ribosomal protein L15